MTPTPQELKPSDYQAALDEMPEDAYLHLSATAAWIYGKHSVIKSALTRCAAEPVDAGELDEAIAEVQFHYEMEEDAVISDDNYDEEDREKLKTFTRSLFRVLQAAKAYRTTQAKGEV